MSQKPPIGLKPRDIHERERFEDIITAIYRHVNSGSLFPKEWLEEAVELYNKIKRNKEPWISE